MNIKILKQVAQGAKNTRWQFVAENNELYDGLFPTSCVLTIGEELEMSDFKQVRPLNRRHTETYVDVITGEVLAQCSEAEFEALLECL